MSSADRRSQGQLVRRYRSRLPFAIGLFGAALPLLVGIAMAVPTSTSNVAEHVIGGFGIVVACCVGALAWTNGVWLTPEGIVKRQTFKRTTIPWATVGSFKVAPVPRNQLWRTIQVELRPLGYSYLTTVAGSERYIQRLIAEFEEYRAELV